MTNSKVLFQTLCLAAAIVFCSPSALKAQDESKEKKQVIDFFADYLAGEERTFKGKIKIAPEDIDLQQTIVWNAWVEANNQFEEEKLIPLAPLKEGKAGAWHLPEELEPDAVLNYYWGTKGEALPQEGLPMYIYTHGSGPRDQEWATGLKLCQRFDDAPSIYFIPQIPNMGNYYRWWQKSKQYAWEKLLREALVSGKVNPDRIYILGISEGGYGSQRLAAFYADYLAAAGPMAGGEPLKNAPAENCRNIAFSFLTGALDVGFYRNELTYYTKLAFDSLQKQYPDGYIHRIELLPNMGHGINYSLTTPWLKQYTRNPYPKSVNWENFEMDGRYRDGFYNLYVLERSNKDAQSRTYYQMNIEGNHIDLKVDLVTYKTIKTDPQWGIELKFEKSYTPVTDGKILIYLNDKLVDLNKEVTVTVNGKKAFQGKVKPELRHMVNSCAAFYDPARIFPAAVEVDIK